MSNFSWQNRRVFVTGATGLLGSHLTEKLVERGAEVVALVRDQVPKSLFYSSGLDQKVISVRGALEDYWLLERTLNEYEIDTVFHLGAQTIVGTANRSPLPTFRANIEGTWNLLEACRVQKRKLERIVIASSDKAYGNLKGESYDEEFPLRGEHPYDVSKSCADLLSQAFGKSYELPVAITRCGNFYGPGDLNFNRLIPGVIRDLHFGRQPLIRSDGQFIRDYIYVEDGALAYLTLAEQIGRNEKIQPGEAFNFSYGLRLKVLDVVDHLRKIMEREDLEPDIRNEASNEIPVQCLNSEKAQRELQWKASFGFEEGLKKTVDWYKSYF